MLSSEVKDLYDAGRIATRQMIRFDFGTGTYGYIADKDEFTHGGLTYQPFGLIEVSDLGGGVGTTADGNFTLRLAASEEFDLTPEMLTQIEDEDYRDRPVRVMDAHFHPDTGALLQVETVARGYIDTMEHFESPEGGAYIEAACEGRQLDYTRKNGRFRTNADQKKRDEGDMFFEHSALSGRIELIWGRSGPSGAQPAPNRTSWQGTVSRGFLGLFRR
ncbi:DUF2163 domain-containing protein [Shinella zoogloeoides]|uniref:DUF2163 domain-containing protein n=1 Tax=Shinella zoogloeoides TaxID=352475 RepID=UPI00299EB25E|nr:DUF2163 domain-containing protein [Shinella zoogloeoides]WPE19967.1 hypothetical protein ShzoTeo12_11470 [Shinella zoogloeoides]